MGNFKQLFLCELVYAFFLFFSLIEILIIIVLLLISVAFLTLLERKVLAIIQRRQGPNVVGIFGLLQPLVGSSLNFLMKKRLLFLKCLFLFFIFLLILDQYKPQIYDVINNEKTLKNAIGIAGAFKEAPAYLYIEAYK
jgi:hypothetical protein